VSYIALIPQVRGPNPALGRLHAVTGIRLRTRGHGTDMTDSDDVLQQDARDHEKGDYRGDDAPVDLDPADDGADDIRADIRGDSDIRGDGGT